MPNIIVMLIVTKILYIISILIITHVGFVPIV